MKPIKLTFENFGPYIEKQTIDFQKLSEKGVFLIQGATGSGKTMIFDALTCALFGKPLTDRQQKMMVSNLTDKNSAEIALVFEEKGQEYIVERTLKKDKSSSRLYEPNKDVIKKGVNERISELIGLSENEFKQVVLLPQGKFTQFLEAESERKRDLFKMIFNTNQYGKYQDRLKERLNDVKLRLDQLEKEMQSKKEEIDEFSANKEAMQAELKAQQQKKDQLEKEIAQKNKKINEQIQWHQQQEELNHAKRDWRELLKQEEVIQQKEAICQQLNQVKSVHGIYDNLSKIQDDYQIKQNDLYERQQMLKQLKVQEAQTKAVGIATYQVLQKERATLQTDIKTLRKTKEQFEKELEMKQQVSQTVDRRLTEEEIDYNYKQQAYNTNEREVDDTKKLQQKIEVQINVYQDIEQQLKKVEQQYEILKQKYFASTVARLAKELEINQPCPVCGSCEHPHKASFESDEIVTDEQLKMAEVQVKQIKTRVEKAKQQKQDLEKDLPKWYQNSTSLEEKEQVLQNEAQRLNCQQKKIQQLKEQQTQLNNEIEMLSKHLEENEKAQQTNEAMLQSLKHQLEAFESEFSKEELEQLFLTEMESQTNYKAWYDDYKKLQDDRLGMEGSINQLKSDIESLKGELEQATAKYQQTLQESNVSEAVYLSLRDKRHNFETYMEEITQYKVNQQHLKQQINEREEILQDKTIEALQPLTDQLTVLQEQRDSVIKTTTALQKDIERYGELNQSYQIKKKDYDKQHVIYQELKKLSDIGKFEDYIQLYYYRNMIYKANHYLVTLTDNRYTLEEGEKVFSLQVRDAYSSESRSIKTLSGGEIFKVSLALALALSDIVQEENAQSNVELLLIDEGFGTLDKESLKQAINVLQHLENQGRMIGCISHVEELTRRIPNQIRVVNDEDRGSRLYI